MLATAAGVIGWCGAFCGTVANVLTGFDLAAAATVHMSSAAAQILVSASTASAAWVFFIGYFAGIPVAIILTGIAQWRDQAIPRWLPVLFVVALIAGALGWRDESGTQPLSGSHAQHAAAVAVMGCWLRWAASVRMSWSWRWPSDGQ